MIRIKLPNPFIPPGASPASRDRGAKSKLGRKGFLRFPKAFSGRNFNVFFRPKAGDLQKKKGLRRNPKTFSDGDHKFQRFFRPKKATSSSQKNTVGKQEINRRRQKRKSGGIAPPCPPADDAPASL